MQMRARGISCAAHSANFLYEPEQSTRETLFRFMSLTSFSYENWFGDFSQEDPAPEAAPPSTKIAEKRSGMVGIEPIPCMAPEHISYSSKGNEKSCLLNSRQLFYASFHFHARLMAAPNSKMVQHRYNHSSNTIMDASEPYSSE